MKNILHFCLGFVFFIVLAGIYYLNMSISRATTPSQLAAQPENNPTKKPPRQLPSQPSKPVPTPSSSLPNKPEPTSWQLAHNQGLTELKEMAEQLKKLDSDSDEFIQLDGLLREKMMQMGLTEFNHNDVSLSLYLPDMSDVLFIARRLDDDSKSHFSFEISQAEIFLAQRKEIEKEMEQNKTNAKPDSPELLQRYHELIAEEFRMQDQVMAIYDAYYASFDQDSGY